MGFSSQVKEKTYIASARRCCVCKKFKGRNIEVHHIEPKADGGPDTFENAIPLCFDCHAEAGHYNPKHPKGASYSPKELRAHRDAWYKVVADGKVHSENTQATHYYYLTNSFDIVSEIINGDFSEFPLDNVKLVENDLHRFLKSTKEFKNGIARESDIAGDIYKSVEDYKNKHKDAKEIKSRWGSSHWERNITQEEIKNKLAPIDFISHYMHEYGADLSDIAEVQFNEHECVDSCYETYYLRRAKVAFLALVNNGDETIVCDSINEVYIDDNKFVEVGTIGGDERSFNLNKIPLSPGECLLIPTCVVLTPFEDYSYQPEKQLTLDRVKSGGTQDTRKICIDKLAEYPTIGPFHKIASMNIEANNSNTELEFRPLLTNNLLLISRYWECGSCPHLLIRNKGSDEWLYIGELFSSEPNEKHKYVIDRNDAKFKDAVSIKIIELENEITYIDRICIDGCVTNKNLMLNIDEEIEINVEAISIVEIYGSYILFKDIEYKKSEKIKYQKVYHLLMDTNEKHLTNKVSAPSEAWRFLPGASPGRVRDR